MAEKFKFGIPSKGAMRKLRGLKLKWLLRKDGVRQRYFTTKKDLKGRGYEYDRHKRAWKKPVVTPPPPPPPPPPPTGDMWRLTLTIDCPQMPNRLVPVRKRYRSYRLQAWHMKKHELMFNEPNFKRILIDFAERKIGVRRENWWFNFQFGRGYQQVPRNVFLLRKGYAVNDETYGRTRTRR